MFLRMSVFVRAKSVFMPQYCPEVFRTAFRASDSGIRFYADPRDMGKADIIIAGIPEIEQTGEDSFPIEDGRNVFLYGTGEEMAERLFERMSGGIWFCGKHNSIFLVRSHVMDKLKYTVRI